ncbi:hypothetical protein DL770_001429 [Monosporascus sp. CRB-9-2]|nr:hypothetical protein DL770_001429 [Monosporascus sp. CRB-9-2]
MQSTPSTAKHNTIDDVPHPKAQHPKHNTQGTTPKAQHPQHNTIDVPQHSASDDDNDHYYYRYHHYYYYQYYYQYYHQDHDHDHYNDNYQYGFIDHQYSSTLCRCLPGRLWGNMSMDSRAAVWDGLFLGLSCIS